MSSLRVFAGIFFLLAIAGGAYAYVQVSEKTSERVRLIHDASKGLSGDSTRGGYVAIMGGCIACHTNSDAAGGLMAGGVPIETPFGTFYSPNITSDKLNGIGRWSTSDFLVAMSVGLSPDNKHYYPSFPYTSYSAMQLQDLLDLKAWLDTVEPDAQTPPDHKLTWPFSIRQGLVFWKALFFDPLRNQSFSNRGSYLVNGPGHCSECHSPRNFIGGLTSQSLEGNTRGPEGGSVPGITYSDLSEWSVEDIEFYLEVGMTPSGDFVGGSMSDVIEHGTSQLSADDRQNIAAYLLSKENE